MEPELVSDERLRHIINDTVAIACLGGYSNTSVRVAAELAARTALRELGVIEVILQAPGNCPLNDGGACTMPNISDACTGISMRSDCPFRQGAVLVKAKKRVT